MPILEIDTLAIIALAIVCAGGLAYALIYPFLSGEVKADERKEAVAAVASPSKRKVEEQSSRKGSVEDAIKELDRRQKSASAPPLNVRIAQAGLTWTKRQFILISVGLGVAAFFGAIIGGLAPFYALGAAIVAGLGLPRWFIEFKKKRRLEAFRSELANAVDVIVRGVKAGLPLGDCLRIIAHESQEPVKSEFRYIIEQTQLGIPLHEAVLKLYERMPIAEANFFCIVVSIQQKAGGNLSEVLANLSKVLRDRKKMKAKIVSMSQEAKASAAIIAALPPCVMVFVYISTPGYIQLLWTTDMGRMLLAGCAFWMLCGVMVMRKMINFDF